MRDFLRIALSRAGHDVTCVDSPAGAAAGYKARDFDVVITDLKMAGGSGLDVLDGVKAARPHTQVVVVTFASGESTKTINGTENGDDVDEPDETFKVTLSGNSANSTLGSV